MPDQTWRAELSYERTFGMADIFTITAFVERVDNFITFIPFDDGTEGRGNIDKLNTKGIDISSTIAFDRFGIDGAKLDITAKFHQSTLIDPVTGVKRDYEQDGYLPVFYEVGYRHDIPESPFAWGLVFAETSTNVGYRLNQKTVQEHTWPQAHKLFVEHKDIAGMTLKIALEDVFGFTWNNSRTFYDGDRNGAITGRETNSKQSPWFIFVSLTGNF